MCSPRPPIEPVPPGFWALRQGNSSRVGLSKEGLDRSWAQVNGAAGMVSVEGAGHVEMEMPVDSDAHDVEEALDRELGSAVRKHEQALLSSSAAPRGPRQLCVAQAERSAVAVGAIVVSRIEE